jgi:hypothetical protein
VHAPYPSAGSVTVNGFDVVTRRIKSDVPSGWFSRIRLSMTD